MPGPTGRRYPPAFLRFVELFNKEQFWESHEVLEEPWRANRSDFYQGLIIFASAFVHAQRGNPTGVCKQMAKAKARLSPYAPHYMGIDVAALLRHAERSADLARAYARRPGDRHLRDAIPFPRLAPDPRLVRGDEPELAEAEG